MRTSDAQMLVCARPSRSTMPSYREVKERAARSGRTIGAVLEDAVRVGLLPKDPLERGRYVVHPTGSGGLLPGIDLSSNSSVQDALDDGVPLDALR